MVFFFHFGDDAIPTKGIFIGHSLLLYSMHQERSVSYGKARDIFVTITGFQALLRAASRSSIGQSHPLREGAGQPVRQRCHPRVPARTIGKVGYIANSPQTTRAGGTESASRIYERVPKRFYVRVLFTTCTKIICRVEFGDMSDLNAELESQTRGQVGRLGR